MTWCYMHIPHLSQPCVRRLAQTPEAGSIIYFVFLMLYVPQCMYVGECTPHSTEFCVFCITTLPPTLVHQLLKLPIEPCQLSPVCTFFDSYMLIKPRLRDKIFSKLYMYKLVTAGKHANGIVTRCQNCEALNRKNSNIGE